MKKTLLLALFICAFIRLKAQSFEFSLQAGSGLSRFSGSSSASNSTIAGAVGGSDKQLPAGNGNFLTYRTLPAGHLLQGKLIR
jgi:hypothetical protein